MKYVLGGLLIAFGALSVTYWAANTVLETRFPSTASTIGDINALGNPLRNTKHAFLSEGSDRSVPFRVLFYGQSITEGTWPEHVIDTWGKRYPHLAIDYENRAIGGFSATRLQRTIATDIADLSPDLVVFHAYGQHTDYEKTIDTLARMTGADVILQTDHLTEWPAQRCDIGVAVLPDDTPGCRGFPFRLQTGWSEYMAYHFIPSLAERYGFAVEPRLQNWTRELRARGLEPAGLLKDHVHVNDTGASLMAELLDAFVTEIVNEAIAAPMPRRIRMDLMPPDNAGRISFQISDIYRVEAVGTVELPPRGLIVVDQQPVETMDACFAHSRVSKWHENLVWPAIIQVGTSTGLVEEEWTVVITDLSEDGANFSFSVSGSVTGPDGTGTSTEDFTSSSGRVRILAQDWTLEEAYELHDVSIVEPFEVTWESRYLCDDMVDFESDAGTTYIRTLATGLRDGPHSITLTIAPYMIDGIDYLLLTPNRTPR